jgi:hypothetical protein
LAPSWNPRRQPKCTRIPTKKPLPRRYRHVEALSLFISRPRSEGRTAHSRQWSTFLRECNNPDGLFGIFCGILPPDGGATRVHAAARAVGDLEEPFPRGSSTAGLSIAVSARTTFAVWLNSELRDCWLVLRVQIGKHSQGARRPLEERMRWTVGLT